MQESVGITSLALKPQYGHVMIADVASKAID